MVRFLPFLISLVLSVYALFSCIQTPDEDVPHLPKLVWVVLIVFVPFVGPIVWLLMSRAQTGRGDAEARPHRPAGRPVAPDDDPDFLKSLDRYRDPRTTAKPPEPPKRPEPETKQDDVPDARPQDSKPKDSKPKDSKPKKSKDKRAEDDATETRSDSDDA